jgi:PAS domain S-box-containing protein
MNDTARNGGPTRMGAEEALRRSESRYRALVEATSQVVWSWSPDGGPGDFADTQRWWEELTGQTPEEQGDGTVGWLAVVHPEDRDTAAPAWRNSLASGKPYRVEYRVKAREGVWRHIQARGVPIRDHTGSILEWVGTLDDVTERRVAEETALLSEVRFRELFEQSPLSIQIFAPDGRTLRVNRAWEELWGLTLDQLADYNLLGDPQLEAKGVAPYLRRAVAGEAVTIPAIQYDPEETIPGRTSHENPIRWVSAVAYPLKGLDGRVQEVVLIHQDVTLRHLAEEAVRKNEAWLQTVCDSLPALVSYVGTDLRYRFVNKAYEEWFGLPTADILGKTIPDVLGQEDFALRRHGVEAALAGEQVRFEALTRHKRLGCRMTEIIYTPHWEGSGVVGFFVHVHDVTERTRVEEDLARVMAESEKRRRLYEAILSSTPDFVYVFSLDYRILYANASLIAMWGYSLKDTIGKTFLEVGYEPWHAEMHCREIDQVRETRKPIRGEVPFTGTSGRRIYDYIFVPVLGADGEVEAVAGTTRDMTERKAMENELRETDRKKDDFIALLAHELRNPLAPIRNGLQVMRLAGKDPVALTSAREMMDRQLSHMVRLIDDLLDISRINRSKMALRRERVLLADVMGSAMEAARPLIEAAGHELTVTLPVTPVAIDGDPVRLAQVFSNLLTNSAKYTEQGGRIRLRADRSGGHVVVSIRDNGIGIPEQSLPRIFDMFSQVDRSIERTTGGLGIGLALVKGLVEMHGGTVAAASGGIGKGSVFTVTLPLASQDARTATTQETIPLHAVRRRVLVVDDNRDGAESMALMLHLLGDEVRTANDGVEAVALAEAFRPEVILMDVGMPRLNGLEATRRIREQPWGQDMTIIALTGWGQEGDLERSREAGCDAHLVKPVNLNDLEKMLAELA